MLIQNVFSVHQKCPRPGKSWKKKLKKRKGKGKKKKKKENSTSTVQKSINISQKMYENKNKEAKGMRKLGLFISFYMHT